MYYLSGKFKHIYFTRREAECMVHFLQHDTIKTTAEALKISPRTVEFYLNNMKTKLQTRSKARLIELVSQTKFMQYTELFQAQQNESANE